ncbi:MAG: aminopeptidase P family protein [Candidatus Aenigmarchaeota archaeon]|nr:aminopeptidase P family protein [Candidatus Aenigmarchaeota archaeon]
MRELQERLNKFRSLEASLDGIVIFNLGMNTPDSSQYDPNFFYFTNSTVNGIFYYDFSTSTILTNSRDFDDAKRSWADHVVLLDSFSDFITSIKNKRIGVDRKNMLWRIYHRINRQVQCVDISAQLQQTRSIKTPYEQRMIQHACQISKKVCEKFESEFSPSLTEFEFKGLIDFIMNKYGGIPAFSTIVACGNNIRIPHDHPGNHKLTKPILVDFGVRYKGYVSDVSRTWGSPYEPNILKVFDGVFPLIKPGVTGEQLHTKACELLGKYEKHFNIALGHGIGIQVHENPVISIGSREPLEPGMVFAIEPAIHVKNGIRIEHDILLTEKGFKNLTSF